jgi:mRNA-degrading endonuclease RelE of RelBE toxin-antitoxin system
VHIIYHNNFLKLAERLPVPQQKKLAEIIILLQNNPFHPTLHTKRLNGELIGVLSFRITRDWRGTFQFLDNQTIQLLRVKHRKDIYR